MKTVAWSWPSLQKQSFRNGAKDCGPLKARRFEATSSPPQQLITWVGILTTISFFWRPSFHLLARPSAFTCRLIAFAGDGPDGRRPDLHRGQKSGAEKGAKDGSRGFRGAHAPRRDQRLLQLQPGAGEGLREKKRFGPLLWYILCLVRLGFVVRKEKQAAVAEHFPGKEPRGTIWSPLSYFKFSLFHVSLLYVEVWWSSQPQLVVRRDLAPFQWLGA